MTKSFLTGKYFFKVIIINQKTMKQKLIQAVLFGSCMAFAVSCGQAPTARGEAEYSVMTISTSDVTIPSTHSATIRGRQDIAIYPQVSGTISKVCVKEGEVVRQGQLLFIIDQVPYKAALQTAKANVAAAEASVATAQLTYDSKKELFAKNVVSQFDLQTSQNNLLTAKSQLAQAEAQQCGQQPLLYRSEKSVQRRSRCPAVSCGCPGERIDSPTADHRIGQLRYVRLFLPDGESTARPDP